MFALLAVATADAVHYLPLNRVESFTGHCSTHNKEYTILSTIVTPGTMQMESLTSQNKYKADKRIHCLPQQKPISFTSVTHSWQFSTF